ncbi:hypothetical protein VHTUMSATKI_35130 [Vibrio harveyi]
MFRESMELYFMGWKIKKVIIQRWTIKKHVIPMVLNYGVDKYYHVNRGVFLWNGIFYLKICDLPITKLLL